MEADVPMAWQVLHRILQDPDAVHHLCAAGVPQVPFGHCKVSTQPCRYVLVQLLPIRQHRLRRPLLSGSCKMQALDYRLLMDADSITRLLELAKKA